MKKEVLFGLVFIALAVFISANPSVFQGFLGSITPQGIEGTQCNSSTQVPCSNFTYQYENVSNSEVKFKDVSKYEINSNLERSTAGYAPIALYIDNKFVQSWFPDIYCETSYCKVNVAGDLLTGNLTERGYDVRTNLSLTSGVHSVKLVTLNQFGSFFGTSNKSSTGDIGSENEFCSSDLKYFDAFLKEFSETRLVGTGVDRSAAGNGKCTGYTTLRFITLASWNIDLSQETGLITSPVSQETIVSLESGFGDNNISQVFVQDVGSSVLFSEAVKEPSVSQQLIQNTVKTVVNDEKTDLDPFSFIGVSVLIIFLSVFGAVLIFKPVLITGLVKR